MRPWPIKGSNSRILIERFGSGPGFPSVLTAAFCYDSSSQSLEPDIVWAFGGARRSTIPELARIKLRGLSLHHNHVRRVMFSHFPGAHEMRIQKLLFLA